MAHLVCLLRGHKRTPVVFASHRYYCSRCGLDFGADEPANAPQGLFSATTTPIPRPDRTSRYRTLVDLRGKS
jgi:hypothetical protein